MPGFSSFHDVRFPVAVAFGASGGPERRTEIVSLTSGRETRNARFAHARRRYDAGTGLRALAELYDVVAFFEARRGPLHAFRFRDPFDMKSCRPDQVPTSLDQVLGAGDGTRVRFALTKQYGEGPDAYRRPIRKPTAGTLVAAVSGTAVALGSAVTFDDATGDLVFAPGHIPPAEALVTAGYEFDVPVRFDTERLEIGIESFKAGKIPSIPLIEVSL